jgi:outer membrane receptor for Fe3+-dicitrate
MAKQNKTRVKQAGFFFLWMFFAKAGMAQLVSGIVAGSDKKLLEGVTVYHVRIGRSVYTNETGFFSIKNVRTGDTLRFTHVSYTPQEKVVVNTQPLKVMLNATAFQLQEVVVSPRVDHLNVIANIDVQTHPVNSSQELLQKVPGLFIGQHAGGGKAEQLFLRGFDADHGTDINISVDGMPVNMVSHAHGQGYADLHFLLPENMEEMDFDKGPYHADKGNLATAGYVAFTTKERLTNSAVTLEGGQFHTFRTLGQFNIRNSDVQSTWLSAEYKATDGYFDAPQRFRRTNFMGKHTAYLKNNDKISVSVSHFASQWNASGQVPERAVQSGLIDRFGSIDDTEGGNTQRTNVNIQYLKRLRNNGFINNTAFYSHYGFELYSNFTFFLKDTVNGDQIRQKEKRDMMGFESQWNKTAYWGNVPVKWQLGVGLRHDAVHDLELSHTFHRQTTIDPIVLGHVNESNFFTYANTEIHAGRWMINPAIRADYLQFAYTDQLVAGYPRFSQGKAILSPKLNFLFTQNRNMQFFLKLGKGFHSNDTRVVVMQKGKDILPAAYGADLGMIWKPLPRLVVNTAFWYLYLEQEFVYAGDDAVIEPAGKTERKGIDLGLRYQLGKSVFINGDLTYTQARTMDEAKGNDHIPLAPKLTFTGGISLKNEQGWNGSIQTRLLGNRPANENNSLVAAGYCITNMNLAYGWKRFSLGAIIENIFNTKWKETQFATESRLKNEPMPVTEIHFTPGTPFNARMQLVFNLLRY